VPAAMLILLTLSKIPFTYIFYYMLWSKIDNGIFFSQNYISSHCCPVKKIDGA